MKALQELCDEAYWTARAAADDPCFARPTFRGQAETIGSIQAPIASIQARYAQRRAATLSLADRMLRGVE